jgi:hypothetical protein
MKRIEQIAALNDLARTAMGVASRVTQTDGIRALSSADQSTIRERVETFCDFNEDNNPWGERDFGTFMHNDDKIMWKIDYFDKALEFHSDDPVDPHKTTRVLTIMLAEEY